MGRGVGPEVTGLGFREQAGPPDRLDLQPGQPGGQVGSDLDRGALADYPEELIGEVRAGDQERYLIEGQLGVLVLAED